MSFEADIEQSVDLEGGGLIALYAKGHHDADAFYEAATREFGAYEETWPPIGYVRRSHWRNVPTGDGWYRHEESEPGPGAYPVTVLEVDRYRVDRGFAGRLVRQALRAREHARRCNCEGAGPCAWRDRVEQNREAVERQSRASSARLGDRAADAWKTLLNSEDSAVREQAILLLPEWLPAFAERTLPESPSKRRTP